MRIAMIGTGYVGLVSGTCFASLGHDVICVDIDPAKVAALEAGDIPIYEPGLADLVAQTRSEGKLSFTTEIAEAVPGADAVFIAVGTPPNPEDGHADLKFLYAAAEGIAAHMSGFTVIVDKSTVPVGTARNIANIIARTRDARTHDTQERDPRERDPRERDTREYEVVSNPEFLREGTAIEDFMKPDRIVVGVDSVRGKELMEDLYKPLTDQGYPLLITSPESAELIKYASNAFLATKIGFINEIADMCERTGAHVSEVARGIGLDTRIGSKFLMPGPGFGGSCFPKDTLEFAATARQSGAPSQIVDAVIASNNARKRAMASRVEAAIGERLEARRIAVLGLTFKAETDDMRESPALDIIDELKKHKAKVAVHDPKGMEVAKDLISDVEWCEGPFEAMAGAEAAIIVTEWSDYRNMDLGRAQSALKRPVIVDLRNLFDPQEMAQQGFIYSSIGRITPEIPKR